jgi:hypothetical protein
MSVMLRTESEAYMIYILKYKLFRDKRFKSFPFTSYIEAWHAYEEAKRHLHFNDGGFVQLYMETEKHPILAEMIGDRQ